MGQAPTDVPRQRAPVAKPERARAKERRGRLPRRSDSGHKQQVKASPKRGTITQEPEVSAGEAALTGGDLMARNSLLAPRSARALPARVRAKRRTYPTAEAQLPRLSDAAVAPRRAGPPGVVTRRHGALE